MTFNHYPVGWAHAMDTPFQWTKQIASHFGGTRNGMVIPWPARIKDKGGLRTQFSSVIDSMPTILEAVGVPAPTSINGVAQKPIEGTSLVYSFDDAKAPSKHTTQYFEMFGNRAIYHDGWVAATTPGVAPWDTAAETEGRLPAVLDYTSGSSTTSATISARPSTSLPRNRPSSRKCRSFSGPKRRNTACSRSRTAGSTAST